MKGREIMHVHGHDAVDSHRFKQARHIARRDGIPRLAFPVFAGVAEVGSNRSDATGGGVAQCDKEKETAKLVVHALQFVAIGP